MLSARKKNKIRRKVCYHPVWLLTRRTAELNRKLPRDLETWRLLEAVTESIPVWEAVRPVLLEAGIVLWASDGISSYAPSGQTPLSNGFAYVPPVRAKMSWSKNLHEFNCQVSVHGMIVLSNI